MDKNALVRKVVIQDDVRWHWFCVGCGRTHGVSESENPLCFNGDVYHPTFVPSILIRSGHYIPGHQGDCWCMYNDAHPDEPSGFQCRVCHSFVRDGKIEYLSGCTHEYAGKTVDMVPY